MRPLYPPEGGSPKAFCCCEKNEAKRTCGKVTRTQRGMWAHLRKIHNVKKQAAFVFETNVPLVEPVLSRSGDPERKRPAGEAAASA